MMVPGVDRFTASPCPQCGNDVGTEVRYDRSKTIHTIGFESAQWASTPCRFLCECGECGFCWFEPAPERDNEAAAVETLIEAQRGMFRSEMEKLTGKKIDWAAMQDVGADVEIEAETEDDG